MRIPLALAVLATGALLAGAMLGAQRAQAGQFASPAVLVPIGRIGDEFVYEFRTEAHYIDTAYGNRVSTNKGIVAIKVNGIRNEIDQALALHSTVAVDFVISYPSGYKVRGQQFIDLDSRDVIQQRFASGDTDYVQAETVFGPVGENPTMMSSSENEVWSHNETFEFQGRTLRVWEDLTAWEQGPVLEETLRGERRYESRVGSSLVSHRYEFTSNVDSTGLIDGQAVVGITRNYSVIHEASNVGTGKETRTGSYRTALWLSEQVPAPVRIERNGTWSTAAAGEPPRNQGWFNRTLSLVSYRSGGEPIPWGSCEQGGCRTEEPQLERRATTLRHPADGTGSRLPFKLETAVAGVLRDPTLVEFQAWRARHPGHILIGADGGVGVAEVFPVATGEYDSRHHSWDLVFADLGASGSAEQAFSLVAIWDERTSTAVNRERRAVDLAPGSVLRADDFASEPVTIGAVESLWRTYLPENQTGSFPNFVSWGARFVETPNRPAQVLVSRSMLRVLVLGTYEGGFVPKAGQQGISVEDRSASVSVNVSSGRFTEGGWITFITPAHWAYAWYSTYFVPDAARQHLRVFPRSIPPAQPISPDQDPLALGAIGLGSLLLWALLIYLAPLIKYTLSQIAVGWQGYARLDRADLLNNAARDQLLSAIRQEPGISPPELHARVGGGWSTVVYHLRVLEKNQVVSSLIDGRHKRFFPVGEIDHSARGQVAALRNERTQRIFGILLDEPGLRQRDLARAAGLSAPSLGWHMGRLQSAGLVEVQRRGRGVHYFPAAVPPRPKDPGSPFTAT